MQIEASIDSDAVLHSMMKMDREYATETPKFRLFRVSN